MTRRSAQRVATYHRHAAADDREPASLAAQEAAVRSYLAAHPEWKIIPAFDSDRPQPFDRPEATGQPLPASPPDEADTTGRPGGAYRRR